MLWYRLCLILCLCLVTVPTSFASNSQLPNDAFVAMADAGAAYLNDPYQCPGHISAADAQANLEYYTVIDIRSLSAYENGHIPGAFQFTPYASLGLGQMLDNLPTDMPLVVYGWRGMFSSHVVAYLNMLGYEAYNLNFGANTLFHSSLVSHYWSAASMNDFPLEVGSGPSAVSPVAPLQLTSLSNHPNPFNPVTTISYMLSEPARVILKIYDMGGRLVQELVQGAHQSQGWHEFTWQGQNEAGAAVASGVYLCRVIAGSQSESKLLLLVK